MEKIQFEQTKAAVAPDKTTVTLKNMQTYTRKMFEKIEVNTARVFTSEKTSLDKADTDVINEYFTAHSELKPRTGDVFLINTIVDKKIYEQSSYCYSGKWVAITGNVDASKVILRENVLMAGDYDKVGNYTKPLKGTFEIPAKGKSMKELVDGIFTKELQPKITAQPSVSGFSLSGAKAVEAGTRITETSFGTAVLSAGSYEFGPDTCVVAKTYKVDRITQPATLNKESIATTSSGKDNNGGKGFIIGDGNEENVVNSLKYKITVSHGEGVTALTNTKKPSVPVVKISAGTKEQTTSAYTTFRSFFYGTSNGKPVIDSSFVRKLNNSNKPYSPQVLTIQIPVGASRIAIACIGTATGVTKIINESAMNADVTKTFVKSQVNVEGKDGYTAKQYNIWVYEPLEPYNQSQTLKVTLG